MATYEEKIIEILTDIQGDIEILVCVALFGLLFYVASKILKNHWFKV